LEPTLVHPELESLEFRQYPFGWNGDWGLILAGSVAAPESALANGVRVPVRAVSERGDIEEFLLLPLVCVTEDDRAYECATVSLRMQPRGDLREIAEAVEEFPARIRKMSRDGSRGRLWLFGRNVEDALLYGRAWPGVSSVERSWMSYDGFFEPSRTALMLPVLVQFAAPMVGDGILQLHAGEQVALQYVQPDGSLLEATTAMCVPAPGPGAIGPTGVMPPCG
jgi:hypothetical protein